MSDFVELSKEIIDKYDIDRNTFIDKDKKESNNKFETEIGDLKQDNFKPQLKLKRWDNECNFSIRLIDDEVGEIEITTDKDKIQWKKQKKEVHFYSVPVDKQNEFGGYEIDVILKEKPKTNIIKFSLQTKGFDFFHQLPVNEQDLSDMKKEIVRTTETDAYDKYDNIIVHSPENVIKGYAVYHKSKINHELGGKNYGAGQGFFLYRPKIIDNNGWEVWGELKIDEKNNLMTVTISQDFLDKAVYPIRQAAGAFIGYTTAGGSYTTRNDQIMTLKATLLTAGGNISNTKFYARKNQASGMYAEGASYNNTTRVLWANTAFLFIGSDIPQWWTSNGTGFFVAGTQQIGLLIKGTTSVRMRFYYNVGGAGWWKFWTSNTPENPITNPWFHSYRLSVYCTYTAFALPTVTTQAATDITYQSAIGNGNITVVGGGNCDKRGIVYDKASQGDPGLATPAESGYNDYEEEAGDFVTGTFTRELTNLDSETKYYARAYAHNAAGYQYGDEIEFTTLSAPLSPNFTKRKNYNGYLAFVQQYIKHKLNDTTPWAHPAGYIIE